jgi:hypothetical protein
MTDTITVNANPNVDVLQAFIRQLITVAGAAAAALGYSGLAGKLGLLLGISGPLASLIAMGWGLWKTRTIAKKAATMASALPDAVATTK